MPSFEIGISDKQDANLFLRALWAALRDAFGKCAWSYTPVRDGPSKRIEFGFVDVGHSEGPISVGMTYRTKGSINTIEFRRSEYETKKGHVQ